MQAGEVYYVHTGTGEQTWTKPDDFLEDDAGELGSVLARVGAGAPLADRAAHRLHRAAPGNRRAGAR
jgi:hypothetical protein